MKGWNNQVGHMKTSIEEGPRKNRMTNVSVVTREKISLFEENFLAKTLKCQMNREYLTTEKEMN